jgi:inosine-uridine nucleoside N-ribohydrolase
LFAAIAQSGTPLARYLDRFGHRDRPMWDEVAAATWIDESLVAEYDDSFLGVSLDRGAGRGDTLSWPPGREPGLGECRVRVQRTLDEARFYRLFVELCSK